MVMDFGFIKELMMKEIHDPCDHAMIWYKGDPLYHRFQKEMHPELRMGWKNYTMDCVPTAENLARHWFHRVDNAIQNRFNGLPRSDGPMLERINVWETPNCMASYPYVAPQTQVNIVDNGSEAV